MLRALVLALAVCAAAGSEGDSGPFEWAGIFETPEAEYRWIAQAAGGEYVDPGMKFVAMPATAANADELSRLKEIAVRKMTASPAEGGYGQCEELAPGGEGTITPTADKCYKLMFFGNTLDSIFKVPTAGVPAVAFFAQHVPTEFEDTEHYFKDMKGTDIEPSAEDAPEEEEKAKPWGTAIGLCLRARMHVCACGRGSVRVRICVRGPTAHTNRHPHSCVFGVRRRCHHRQPLHSHRPRVASPGHQERG